jgi:hypothetical protein
MATNQEKHGVKSIKKYLYSVFFLLANTYKLPNNLYFSVLNVHQEEALAVALVPMDMEFAVSVS